MSVPYQLTNGILTFDPAGAHDFRQYHCEGKVWLTLFWTRSSEDDNSNEPISVRLFDKLHIFSDERGLSLLICPSNPIQMLVWRVAVHEGLSKLGSIGDQCIQDIVKFSTNLTEFKIDSLIEYETKQTWGSSTRRAVWKRERETGYLEREPDRVVTTGN